jgi:hypothetical protein
MQGDTTMNKSNCGITFTLLCITSYILIFPNVRAYGQDFMTKPVLYSLPGMNDVGVRQNIIYKQDKGEEMKMDIYIPAGLTANAQKPAVLFIHGGPLGPATSAPALKDSVFYQTYGRLMAASGLVGVTFNHRYPSMKTNDMETSFSDVDAAIQFIRTNAAAYNIDPDRIALWAFSGGGPHLSIALKGQSKFIRCLVSYYALLDLESGAGQITEKPDPPRNYSPVAFLTDNSEYIPPVLIARVGFDHPGFNQSVERFVSRMFALNGDITVLSHPFGQHSFDIYNDDQQTRDIIAATITYIKNHLNRPALFDSKKAQTGTKVQTLISEGNIPEARKLVSTYFNTPGDKILVDVIASESSLITSGISQLKKNQETGFAAFLWAVELYPSSPLLRINLAYGYEAFSKIDLAVSEAKKSLELLDKNSSLDRIQKKGIQDAANILLARHK